MTFDHGTRVMVRDLFGSMPVRVKQRGILSSDRVNIDREWSRLVLDTVAILLAWPRGMTIRLNESSTHRELKLKTPAEMDAVLRTARLLSQASLTQNYDVDSWIPVSATVGEIKCTGCISTIPSSSRKTQFICIGIQPLSNTYGTNTLYEEINKVFANSSFGTIEGDGYKANDGCERSDGFTSRELRVRKGVDRWPMFHLQLEFQHHPGSSIDDILDSRTSDLTAVTDLLKAMCYSFLKRHHHRPRKLRTINQNSVFSTDTKLGVPIPPSASQTSERTISGERGTEDVHQSSFFDSWHRVKVGLAPKRSTPKGTHQGGEPHPQRPPLVGSEGKLLRRPFDDAEDDAFPATQESAHFVSSQASSAAATDPAAAAPPGEIRPAQLSNHSVLQRRPKPQPRKWLQNVLSEWKNPVFENTPRQMPRSYGDAAAPGIDDVSAWGRSNYFAEEGGDVLFESTSIRNLGGRISKKALSDAEVVGQVDRKFILVRLPMDGVYGPSQGPDTSALIILDQHAADERRRLEELMSEYFVLGPSGVVRSNTEPVESPLVFEVAAAEGDSLRQYQAFFSSWGIDYRVSSSQRPLSQEPVKITILTLPPSIFERCTTEPRLLIDLLRKQIHGLPHPPPLPSFSLARQQSHISNFHGCPRGILELLHSRSCRTAIMFNDELSQDECEGLVKGLAGCAFPFQCAHGRPSMVPVLDLGLGSRVGGWNGDEETVSKATWKEWMM